MFNCLASYPHAVRRLVQSKLHGFKNRFMFPAAHPSFGTGRALGLDLTLTTMRTPIPV